MAAVACGGPILRPLPPASRLAFLQFYLAEADGCSLDQRSDGTFFCHEASAGDSDAVAPLVGGADRGEIFRAFRDGLEGTAEIQPVAQGELPPQAGPAGLPLGPSAPPNLCDDFWFGPDASPDATEMAISSPFSKSSLLAIAPGPPEPSSAALRAAARRLDADALLRVILVPWQWSHSEDGSAPEVARVEVFAEIVGYDRSGRRFLWDLFRSEPSELAAPGNASATYQLQELLLDFAEKLGGRVGAEGFRAP